MKLSPNVKLNSCNCIKDIDEMDISANISIKNLNTKETNKVISFYSNNKNKNKNNKIKTLF